MALDSNNVEARVAAATSVALLAEASIHIMTGGDEEEEEDVGEQEEDGPVSQVVGDRGLSTYQDSDEEAEEEDDEEESFDDFVGVTEDTELVAKLREMYRDCDKHRSKKDRAHQRGILRQVLATFDEGEFPEESFQVRHSHVDLYGWVQMVQITALRRVLGGGIQTHICDNPALQELFGLGSDFGSYVPEKMTPAEKRAWMGANSSASKARDMDRKNKRSGSAKGSAFH